MLVETITKESVEDNVKLMRVVEAQRLRHPHKDALTWISLRLGIDRGFCRRHLSLIGVSEERIAQLAGDLPPVEVEHDEEHDEDQPAPGTLRPTAPDRD